MKIYQTRLGNLSTSVDVNGVPRRVQFLASDGVNGIFSTADEQLQRAMENSRVWETIQIVGRRTAGIGRENLYVSTGGSLLAGRKGLFEKRAVRAF